MNKQDIISSFQNELKYTAWDIRAEALLAVASKSGLNLNDVMINCDRFFKREFSKDIFSSEIKEDSNKQELVELHLSRTGIYDLLPEGLFFQIPQKRSRQMNVSDAVSDYKLNKKKEEGIRKFFQPFDNGFFTQRLQIEKEEFSLLEGLRTGILNDFFINFWGLPVTIPKMFMVPLVVLLPHAHKIAGNLELTARCLGFLLKEKVRMVQKKSVISSAEYANPLRMGDGRLGIDMVCGQFFYEDCPVIEIKIGPLKNSRMKEYIGDGKRAEVIDTFNRFFIPAGLDVSVLIELAQETTDISGMNDNAYIEGDMILEKGAEPILGYSTVLG
ncbi:MAG: type VI secretion system baseplate subunit TssG [Ferruginibacter sp.]